MRSVKAAGAMMLVIALGVAAALFLSRQPLAAAPAGAEMPLSWRLSLYLLNWYIRLAPVIVLIVATVAVLTALFPAKTSIEQERRGLLVWLVVGLALAGACSLSLMAFPLGSAYEELRWWVPMTMLAGGFAGVAWIASIAVAARLQSRLHQRGARVRGWQVAAAGIILATLGPAALLPGLWVWWHSRTVPPDASR
jgi:hypothetical protein